MATEAVVRERLRGDRMGRTIPTATGAVAGGRPREAPGRPDCWNYIRTIQHRWSTPVAQPTQIEWHSVQAKSFYSYEYTSLQSRIRKRDHRRARKFVKRTDS